jgi:hypothetical protein
LAWAPVVFWRAKFVTADAKVVERATAEALSQFGVPEKIVTDKGKQ